MKEILNFPLKMSDFFYSNWYFVVSQVKAQIFRSFHGLDVMKNVMRNEHTSHKISHTN